MTRSRLDYLTIAGLAIFFVLEAGYYIITSLGLQIGISLNPPSLSNDATLPAFSFPNLNLDWFHNMDPVSKILFAFLVILVIGTATGCAGVYMRYRKSRASK